MDSRRHEQGRCHQHFVGAAHLARHGPQQHRVRLLTLSIDPAFAAKVHDVVELYVDLPADAVVLSGDEKGQIQALTGRQDSLPMKLSRTT